jgi:hypothetical protein
MTSDQHIARVMCSQCGVRTYPHSSCRCTICGKRHSIESGCRSIVCHQCGSSAPLHRSCICQLCGQEHSTSSGCRSLPSDDIYGVLPSDHQVSVQHLGSDSEQLHALESLSGAARLSSTQTSRKRSLQPAGSVVDDQRQRKHDEYIRRKERQFVDDLDGGPLSNLAYARSVLTAATTNAGCPTNVGRLFTIDTLDEVKVRQWCSSDVGPMTVQCAECSAIMFAGECCNPKDVARGQAHRFKMCCGDGLVAVPKCPRPTQSLNDLLINKLGNQLPSLNALVAFVGINAYKAEVPGKQYTYRIVGHFDRVICSNLLATPTFAGVYIYDADQQVLLREKLQQGYDASDQIEQADIRAVTDYLLEYNPFAVTLQLGAADQHTPIELLSASLYTMKKPASKGGGVSILYPGDGVSRPHFGVATLKGNSIRDAPSVQLGWSDELNNSQHISYDFASYDALRFPVLFPHGVYGWHRAFKSQGDGSRRVTLRQYYSYMLQDRPNPDHFLMQGKRLLQEYIVDAGAKIEDNDLKFQEHNQSALRADKYASITAAALEGYTGTLGRHFSKPQVLNKSFRNSPAQKRSKCRDFMAAFKFHGGVDAFITMTANPNWPEVQGALQAGMSAEDRQDIVCRVFKLKLDILKQQLIDGILGPNAVIGGVIEFQKRGLPHAHIAVSFEQASKLKAGRDVDLMICAEIPNPKAHPILHAAVLRHHVHTCKCDSDEPGSCIKDGRCKKSFPFDFRNETVLVDCSYPLYRRRNLHASQVSKGGRTINVTDGMIVPYNPVLLLMLDCHCNVQACSQVSNTL